jgi:hypothetical protein
MSEQNREELSPMIEPIRSFPAPDHQRPAAVTVVAVQVWHAIARRTHLVTSRPFAASRRRAEPTDPAEAQRYRDAYAEERRRAINALLFGGYWPH